MKPEEFKDVVEKIYDAMDAVGGCRNPRPMEGHVKRIVDFLKRINTEYPLDSVDLMDMVHVAFNHDSVPSPGTIDILEEKLRATDFYGGELSWKYRHPVLTARFIPKRSAGRYDIIFTCASDNVRSAVAFPLKVTVNKWTDMDEEENHSDECPMFHPDHEDGCPVLDLFMNGDWTDEEMSAAEEECECAADDCGCESEIERTEERVFDDRDEWFVDFERWLLAAHYDGMDEYKSAWAEHKLTFVLPDDRSSVMAECSCGKWTASTTDSERPEGELRTKWIDHVKECAKE